MKLKRVKQGEDVSVYEAENGSVYLLRPVDRKYKGTPKKPVYYLSKRETGESKAHYVSGLFQVGKGLFSLDVQDDLGVKHMFTLRIEPGGVEAELTPGKAREMAPVL